MIIMTWWQYFLIFCPLVIGVSFYGGWEARRARERVLRRWERGRLRQILEEQQAKNPTNSQRASGPRHRARISEADLSRSLTPFQSELPHRKASQKDSA